MLPPAPAPPPEYRRGGGINDSFINDADLLENYLELQSDGQLYW